MRKQRSRKCTGGHRHVQLVGGKARACQVYPEKLAKAVLIEIKQELKHNGILALVYQDLLVANSVDTDLHEYDGHFVDDVTGQLFDTQLVVAAGKEDMATHFAHRAYDKTPISDCWHATGKAPIGCLWIDINKGDDEHPD